LLENLKIHFALRLSVITLSIMSNTVQQANRFLVGTIPSVALNPVIVGPLLWGLTKAPPAIKDRLLKALASAGYENKLTAIVKTLKWLLALSIIRKANAKFNEIALNAWRLKSEKKRWEWNKEVAVVTGGCSGIGLLVVKGLAKKGIRIAILDIQALPATLQGCTDSPQT